MRKSYQDVRHTEFTGTKLSDFPLVFVYGTLKQGGKLHGALVDSDFMGEYFTQKIFRLYNFGVFPAVLRVADGGTRIYGEVYRVDHEILEWLDVIEGVDRGAYCRECVPVFDREFSKLEAFIYLWADPRHLAGQEHLESGVWPCQP